MSQAPLKGETVMTSGSLAKGMLLVKPPSKQRCGRGVGDIDSWTHLQEIHLVLWLNM